MSKLFILLAVAVAAVSAGVLSNEPVQIVSQEQDSSPDGSFNTKFETANGITFQEQGVLKNPGEKDEALSVQGSSSYNSPDGTPVKLTWIADENGFQPQGSHLPVAPPTPEIPAAILRSLEWIAAHPYVEPKNHN